MNTHYQNGTKEDVEYILSENEQFAIQCEKANNYDITYYQNDTLIREVQAELVTLYDKFRDLYFADLELYYRELSNMPVGLLKGGQSSDILIGKESFLKLKEEFDPFFLSLNKHIYVNDCQYLVSTVQNLLHSIEYCFIQFFIKLSQIEVPDRFLNESGIVQASSQQSMDLAFYVETFFIKIYSVLDMMVKIIYELENPINDFQKMSKLRSAEKLWGDRKKLKINKLTNTIFEDGAAITMIESLRNEVVHNGSWEFRPSVYLKIERNEVIERYMLFPDFDEGRLSTAKNRKHFFSTETKVNDVLINIHNEFYSKLLFTLKTINATNYAQHRIEV